LLSLCHVHSPLSIVPEDKEGWVALRQSVFYHILIGPIVLLEPTSCTFFLF
jgi:hypothetical protein